MKRLALLALVLLLAACAARQRAPVSDRLPVAPAPAVAETPPPEPVAEKPPMPTHVVKRGETLVGIALQHGLDYRELAAWNNITNLNVIGVGQVLVLAAPGSAAPSTGGPVTTPLALAGPPIEARPLANTATAKVEPRGQKVPYSDKALAQFGGTDGGAPGPAPVAEPPAPPVEPPKPPPEPPKPPPEAPKPLAPDGDDIDWVWPAKGKLLAGFTESSKGVDIAGKKGASVLAAAAGRVIYADSGLRGYGKLVIIKHNNTWVTAYAHNDNLVVKEQQDVRKGQKIAEMGSSDADQVKLHFEVRRQGKPVDPARILPPM